MAARKKKSETPDVVEGVTLAKLNTEVFERAYGRALALPAKPGIVLPAATLPVVDRVRSLVLWYRATTPMGELAGCDECGGDSDINLDMCPFCGDHEVIDADGNAVPAGNTGVTPAAEDATEPEAKPAEDTYDAVEATGNPEPEPEPPAAATTSPAVASMAGKGKAAPRKKKDAPAAKPAPAKGKASEPHVVSPPLTEAQVEALPDNAQKRRLKTPGSPAAVAQHEDLDDQAASAMARDREPREVPAPVVEVHNAEVLPMLAEDGGVPTPGFTGHDLDKAVKRISKLKADTANSLWHLGHEVKLVLDNRLWMLRTDQAGAVKYRTFKQFVVGELGMSYMHVHRLVQVSSAFTEEEMKQIGVSKCHVMLSVPPERRAGLLEQAGTGASRAQLSDAAAQLVKSERPQPPQRNVKPITVAMAQGRVELQLFARPKGVHGKPSSLEQKANPRTAKGINDDPFAIEILPNDVRVLYNVAKNPDGSWVLIIERRRAKEDELFAAATEDLEEE